MFTSQKLRQMSQKSIFWCFRFHLSSIRRRTADDGDGDGSVEQLVVVMLVGVVVVVVDNKNHLCPPSWASLPRPDCLNWMKLSSKEEIEEMKLCSKKERESLSWGFIENGPWGHRLKPRLKPTFSQENYTAKGWLAIAKLKPLSLFSFLYYWCLSQGSIWQCKNRKWKVKVVSA